MAWMSVFLLVGVSMSIWTLIGGLRALDGLVFSHRRARAGMCAERELTPEGIAVLIPAHNEEVAIGLTIASAQRLIPLQNIHVIADGCTDGTAAIARSHGVHVLELDPGRGKAGGLEAALQHFALAEEFPAVLILDADTELCEDYLSRGLESLSEPGMVALAGYARSIWDPSRLSLLGRLLVSYRARLNVILQWLKYGQTWRYTNVTPIVPGFASIYRTEVLSQMTLNPPGLVIEDFNMTFELRRKRLGKVAFTPSAFATTQDPDNLPDYYSQITRWSLGFWQTVRRHGLWPSWFTATLVFFLTEVVVASVVILLVAVAVLLVALVPLTGGAALSWPWYEAFYGSFGDLMSPVNLLLFLFVPDYVMTVVAACYLRRPAMLVYGFAFLFVRMIDATATFVTFYRLLRTRSNGVWKSPARRSIDGGPPAGRPVDSGATVGSRDTPGTARQGPVSSAVYRDALGVSIVLLLGCGLSLTLVPVSVQLAVAVLLLIVCVAWSAVRPRVLRARRT
jgi:cellulose synthase/poly-beta-1,6-N-acetylglucosamine synthase-like glycosyltransferase